MINGEANGASVHFIDSGVDSGPVIMQRAFDLKPDRTMADFDAAVLAETPDMVIESLRQIESGTALAIPQADAPYYYVPVKPRWDEHIDWTRTTAAIVVRLRARTPGPRGTFVFDDKLWRVVEFREEPLLLPHDNVPGQVIGQCRKRGVLVKTGDTGLWIVRIEPAEGGDSLIPRFAIGAMLRQNLEYEVFELKRRLAELERKLSDKS